MWYFQHKKIVNSKTFYYIVCFTTWSHLCILGILFFLYRTTDNHFNLTIQHAIPSSLDLSLYTVVDPTKPIKLTSQKVNSTSKPVTRDKKAIPTNIKACQQKEPQKTMLSAKSIKKNPLEIDTKKKQPALKKTSNPEQKKKSASTKKGPLKKEELIHTKEKIAPEEKKTLEKESACLDKPPEQPASYFNNPESTEISLDQLEMLRKIDHLQQELLSVWHPPIVQKSNPSCILELYVNWEGSIESITIKESSGILIFDTAARNAVRNMHIPLWAKGKSITITLKA